MEQVGVRERERERSSQQFSGQRLTVRRPTGIGNTVRCNVVLFINYDFKLVLLNLGYGNNEGCTYRFTISTVINIFKILGNMAY